MSAGPDTGLEAALAAGSDRAIALLVRLIGLQEEGETAVQDEIARRLKALGAQVERFDYDPSAVPVVAEFASAAAADTGQRSAVLGRMSGAGAGRSLLLFAHPDSEPVSAAIGWPMPPFAGIERDGRIHGWGVADDLSGIAIALSALEAIAAAGVRLSGDVAFASTPSKRHARGIAALLHHGIAADAALYLHPAESGVGMREIKAFCSGLLEFSLTVSGRQPETEEPSHTAFAHLAVNPVEKLLGLAAALRELDAERAARIHHPRLEDAVGRSTNILISGLSASDPNGLGRVPLSATLSGSIAFPPGETMDAVMAEVEAAIAKAAAADPWLSGHAPQLTWLSGVSGAEVPADHPLFETVAGAVEAICGFRPRVNPMHTSSDIRNPMVQKAIPTIGLGPLCGDLTHNGRTGEWVSRDDHLRAVAVVAASLVAWCGVSQ
ncbi:Peptidase dimerisation domain-containing protein [Devosia enhydra]|uniref:Peptidase dimerisation domain-containing protein n=1 Tax=Devosia enhydra TaxID=665118 RepID=A0A1K2I043_9HYPH|nr:M20/M25/M40 family metallo-hydrolase [Devosia enhydra]SFZ85647.1 Peptidase dimerisation domain-containing protein [Devosia enhydra]